MHFYLVDVFAEGMYQGNQLAVFRNAGELSREAMQAIAREINFAESVFIYSDEPSKAGAFRVRIFTPEYEVPFAGHPTLGAAWVIRTKIAAGPPELVVRLAMKIGTIPVRAGEPDGALFFTQRDPYFGEVYPSADIAHLLGLQPTDLDERLPVRLVSTGLPYLIVPLRGLEAQRRIRFRTEEVLSWLSARNLHKTNHPKGLTAGFFTVCPETYRPGLDFNARMFILENERMVEDAATGSANACWAGYLLRQDAKKESLRYRVEQGCEMNRPSLIYLSAGRRGTAYDIQVGGKVLLVAEGEWG